MDLNLIAVVVHRPPTPSSCEDDAGHENWNPEPTTQASMPNAAGVFVDPFWTGCYCHGEVTELEEGGPSGPNLCSVFKINQRIEPLPASSMQTSAWPQKQPSDSHSICNSIKLHFFKNYQDPPSRQGIQPEDRREFCFSSSIPLIHNAQHKYNVYGLFNYNVHNRSCDILKNFRLVVINLSAPILIPKSIALLCIPGPSPDHHNSVVKVGMFICKIMPQLCIGADKTNFRNPRTITRDCNNTLFFQDLHQLFDVKGTSLPPSVGCYTLCNALTVNKISPKDLYNFTREVITHPSPPPNYEYLNIPSMLRVLRDTIAAMTMCTYEGKYWSDMSLNQPTEDQPFPLSFLPGSRIFQKDDCEGRIAQTQEMVKLLKCMFLASQMHGLDEFVQSIVNISTEISRLALDRVTLSYIVNICVNFGQLLHQGKIEVHTVVGDVCFAAFTSDVQPGSKEAAKSGHSFGVIIYNDGVTHECSILEGTGWERSQLPSDRPISRNEIMFAQLLSKNMSRQGCPMAVCGQLHPLKENVVYQHMYLGNGCLFFTVPKNTTMTTRDSMRYGPGLEIFRQNIFTYPYLPQGNHSHDDAHPNTNLGLFKISTLDFLQEVSYLETVINNRKTNPQLAAQADSRRKLWKALNTSDPQLVNSVQGAREMLQIYQNISAKMPSFRRCLATPPKTEQSLKDLMRSWAILYQSEVPSKTGACYGIMCSIQNIDTTRQHKVETKLPQGGLYSEAYLDFKDDTENNRISKHLMIEPGSQLSLAMQRGKLEAHSFMRSKILRFAEYDSR